jgi:hypothetical protein
MFKGGLPSVSDDNLGRILVRHNHGWAWQSASVGKRMVSLKGLLDHACMQI